MCSYQDIQQGNVHHIRIVSFLQKWYHWCPLLLVLFLFNPYDATLNTTVLTIVASCYTT